MTRREIVLNKLQNLPKEEVEDAIRQLIHHIKVRLLFRSLFDRTKSGAHGGQNLGMDAINFYVGESFRRLYEPNGWDWKYDKYSFAEQLIRIANKLISDKVSSYKKKKDSLPAFEEKDVSDFYDLSEIAQEDITGNEEVYSKLVEIAHKVAEDDDDLSYYTIRYFEAADPQTIASEMDIPIKQVYVLRKKLVRRLLNFKEVLTPLM